MFVWFRRDQTLTKDRIFCGIARLSFHCNPISWHAETFEEQCGKVGFRRSSKNTCIAAREHEAEVWVLPRKLNGSGHSLGRVIERYLTTYDRSLGTNDPTQHDDASGSPPVRDPRAETGPRAAQ